MFGLKCLVQTKTSAQMESDLVFCFGLCSRMNSISKIHFKMIRVMCNLGHFDAQCNYFIFCGLIFSQRIEIKESV